MKKLFLSLVILIGLTMNVEAQQYVRLTQAGVGDTIRASQTIYTSSVNLNLQSLQAVVVSVKTTSVSGTPDVQYTIQRSNDNVNWWSVAGDTMTYSATVTKFVTINPFYGTYCRVQSKTGSGAQKTKSMITLKSWNIH